MIDDVSLLFLKLKMQDIIFNQHLKSLTNINIVLNIMNLVIVIVGVMLNILLNKPLLSYFMCLIIFWNLILVLFNSHIHDKTYKVAKEELNEYFDELEDSENNIEESNSIE